MAVGLPPFTRLNLGDVVEDRRVFLATRLPAYGWAWRVGVPTDRHPPGPGTPAPFPPITNPPEAYMDLQSDKQVTLSGAYTDENGNPVDAPAGAVVTYTVDDPAVIALTDNGDGTATAASTGTLGVASVHAEAAFDGRTATGDLQIVVVTGDAERFTVTASEPTEVTPDA